MKKILLTLGVLILSVFSMFAESYTVEFKTNTSDATNDLNSDKFMEQISKGAEYVASFADISKVYSGISGIKMSSSKVNGAFTMNLSNQGKVNATAVTINAIKFGSDAGKVAVNGSDPQDITGSALTFALDGKELTSIKIDATKRLYIKSITVQYGAATTKTEATLSFDVTKCTTNLGEPFSAPKLTVTPEAAATEVKYSSDNEGVATVDAVTGAVTIKGAGNATIKASIENSETYYTTSAEYTIKVVDPNAKEYTIEFSKVDSDATSDISADEFLAYCSYGSEYIESVTDINKVYKATKGLKFSSSKADGSITLNLSVKGQLNVTEIVVNAVGYSGDTSTLSVNDSEAQTIATDALANYTYTFNGSKMTSIKLVATKRLYVQSITVKYTGEVVNLEEAGLSFSKTEDTVDLKEATYTLAVTNPNNLPVAYASSDETVATVNGEGVVSLLKAGKVTITATSEQTDKYYAGKASYTLTIEKPMASIAELKELADNTTAKIGFAMTVGFVNGKNVFATDGTDWIQIYSENTYKVGDVIPAGWTATYTLYQGVTPQLTPVELPVATETAAINFREIESNTVTVADVNEVLILKGVEFAEATPATKTNFDGNFAGQTVTLRNNYTLASVDAGKYDVKVVVTIYQNNPSLYVVEYLCPLKAEELTPEHDTYELVLDEAGNGMITLAAIEGVTLYYKHTPKPADATTQAVDHTGYTAATVNAETNNYEIPVSAEGTVTYYGYHELTDTKGVERAIEVKNHDIATGIENVESAESAATYYNLQGVRVAHPTTGLYIRRQGNTATKVLVK